MTRLPKPKQWVFSRETQLERGEQRIDALDIESVPIRPCAKEHIPGTHLFTADGANAEGEDQ
jgi:hypothetical protein